MFEYVRILVPSYDIGIWSHKWKKRVLIMTWLYFVYTGTYLYIPRLTLYIPCVYTSNDNSVISCFRVVCCCWTMLAYILHAQYSAACSLKWKKNTCADHQVCRLGTLVYIPVYTTYSSVHTEIYHPLLGIRLKPSCEPVLSRLPACAVHCSWRPSSPQSAR